MGKSKTDITKITQDFWEPRIGYRPNEAEADFMVRNVASLFKLLREWDDGQNSDSNVPQTKGLKKVNERKDFYKAV